MAKQEGSLTAAQPNGAWFAPTGPFTLYRDGGTGTVALMVRALGDTDDGVPTGDVLTAAGAVPGDVGARGGVQLRLVLTGAGPVLWKAFW